jgi:hypothetical protein
MQDDAIMATNTNILPIDFQVWLVTKKQHRICGCVMQPVFNEFA